MKATSVIITYYKAIILQIKMKFLEIGVNIGNVQRNTENTIPLHKLTLQSNKKYSFNLTLHLCRILALNKLECVQALQA